jgi:SAM-dependent methyltransferase
MFDDDEIPVESLFRGLEEMPHLERIALEVAQGKILDVGAGSGCHSIALQKLGKAAVAIDISPLSVEVMKRRGLDARQINLFDETFTEKFDTILMLMNGTGIVGTLDNMPVFFERMKQLLAPGGCILIDSSDLRYLYEEEDGSLMIDLADDYYGQLDYRMEYKNILGEPFDWLYVDFETLAIYAEESGFTAELLEEGEHYDYLAKLTIN